MSKIINLTRWERAVNLARYYALDVALLVALTALFIFLIYMNVHYLRA